MGSSLSRFDYNLPQELIEELLKYLSPSDLLKCRLVCHDWNEQALLTAYPKVVFNVDFSEGDSRTLLDDNTAGKWTQFKFMRCQGQEMFGNPGLFWVSFHNRITSLEFYRSQIYLGATRDNSEQGYEILCPNLRKLSVVNCDDYFRDFGSRFALQDTFQVDGLDTLNVSDNSYLTDRIVLGMLLRTRNLRSLNLANTRIQFCDVIYKRFYPLGKNSPTEASLLDELSDYVYTFEALRAVYFDTSKAQNLKELVFDNTELSGSALMKIFGTKFMRLESFSMVGCNEIKDDYVTYIRNMFPSITIFRTE